MKDGLVYHIPLAVLAVLAVLFFSFRALAPGSVGEG
jgi:hypothetical protein